MRLETLGVDRSVSAVFPSEVLLELVAYLDIETGVCDIANSANVPYDCVITLEYDPCLLDVGWVHSIQSGVDRFPLERFREQNTILTSSRGIHGDAIGETVSGYLLAFARRLHRHLHNQNRKRWEQPEWDEAWTIAGERACVVGLGTLGRGIVNRLSALGLIIDGVRQQPLPVPGVDRLYVTSELHTAVSDSRFVIVAVPLQRDTRELIDADVFEYMREDAYLINVARGGVVDQPALIKALENETIAGAALDVFETEPLPESSRLWDMEEVIVTPHAGALGTQYSRDVAAIVRENVRRIRTGEEPVNRVV